MDAVTSVRLVRLRSRWAAIGAAVAVTFGAGGLGIARAATSAPASLVTIDPVRVLDTRIPVGLDGPLTAGGSRTLDVTGTIPVAVGPTQIANAAPVPDGATGIVANVTVVSPTSIGFVSVRPGDATGVPATSSLNITSPGTIVPNSVTVGIPGSGPATGSVDLYFHGEPGATTHLLIDIVGYYLPAGGGGTGTQGPPGPPGPTGEQGPPGPKGADGDELFESTVVVNGIRTPAENGYRLRNAIESARGSAQYPITILVEPGQYDLGASTLDIDEYVSLVGSGRGVTTIRLDSFPGIGITAGTTIADLTIENMRDSSTTSTKVVTLDRADGAVLRDIEVLSEFDSGISVYSSADVLLDGVEIEAGDTGLTVSRQSALQPPSTVTIIGSTISSQRAAIWGVDDGDLVTVRESRLTSEVDTINAYMGGKIVVQHSTVVATIGAWARVHTNIDVSTVYEVAQTHIQTAQAFNSTGLLTAPRCVGITTPSGSSDTCP